MDWTCPHPGAAADMPGHDRENREGPWRNPETPFVIQAALSGFDCLRESRRRTDRSPRQAARRGRCRSLAVLQGAEHALLRLQPAEREGLATTIRSCRSATRR